MTEMLVYCGLRERSFGTQEPYLQRLFLREARRHDFTEQAQHFLVAQRSLIALESHAQHLCLALRTIVVDRVTILVLGNPGLARQARALADEFMNLRIDGVDAIAQLIEPRTRRALRRFAGHGSENACRKHALDGTDALEHTRRNRRVGIDERIRQLAA